MAPRRLAAPPPASAAPADAALPAAYAGLLEAIKADVRAARTRAALAANRELIALYWRIGRVIVERQAGETWGSAVLERLAADLRAAFPGLSGFSRTNLFRVRAFYLAWSAAPSIVPQPVGQLPPDGGTGREPGLDLPPEVTTQLPWGHNVALLELVKDPAARRWYAEQAIAHGWSRSILELQIRGRLHERQGRAVTNFARTLPADAAAAAEQVLRDPYLFDFLGLGPQAHERDVEQALAAHVGRAGVCPRSRSWSASWAARPVAGRRTAA